MSGFPSHFFPSVPAAVGAANLVGFQHLDATLLQRVLPAPAYNALGLATAYAIGYHEMDMKNAKRIFKYNPNPTSTETIRHYIACKEDNRFR